MLASLYFTVNKVVVAFSIWNESSPTLEDIDFLAGYVTKKDLWYVLPADAFIPRVTVHFNYGPLSQGMFEICRETWCLLTCAGKARGKGDIPKRCRCEEMPVRCVVCPKR